MNLFHAVMRPAHVRMWKSGAFRARNLLRFAEIEADGGRDLVRAAEKTRDPILRRLFIFHAKDEHHHADLFRRRGAAIAGAAKLGAHGRRGVEWLTPGERGFDDLRIDDETDAFLLAFLHLSEKSAAADFAFYRDVMQADPATRAVFEEVLGDETFHMNYTLAQLKRVAPQRSARLLWRARLGRLWKAYLRLALGVAGLFSGVALTLLYLLIIPPFALLAKAAERREPVGWRTPARPDPDAMKRQY